MEFGSFYGIAAYFFISKALSIRETENARLHINSLRLIWKTDALITFAATANSEPCSNAMHRRELSGCPAR